MKDFVSKLQKDLKGLQDAIKKDSDELLKKVKTYATKDNLQAAGAEVEKLLEQRLRKLEPTVTRVVGEIRKNAAKAGINVDELESKVRSNVNLAANTLRDAAEKRGLTKAAKDAAERAKELAKKATSKAKSSTQKKPAKAKSPSSKAATRRSKPSQKVSTRKVQTTKNTVHVESAPSQSDAPTYAVNLAPESQQ